MLWFICYKHCTSENHILINNSILTLLIYYIGIFKNFNRNHAHHGRVTIPEWY